jgi:hypothetical protein
MRRFILLVAGLPLAFSAIVSTAAQASLPVLLLIEGGSLLALVLVLATVLRLEVVNLDRLVRQGRQHSPVPGGQPRQRPRLKVLAGGGRHAGGHQRP